MHFDLNRCLEAFAIALDYAEAELFDVRREHSRRVAFLSLSIGRELGLDDDDLRDLLAVSLLHDSGLTEGAPRCGEYADPRPHCEHGQQTVDALPLRRARPDVLRFHHDNVDGSGAFGVGGDELPVLSQVVRLADLLERSVEEPAGKPPSRDQVRALAVAQADHAVARPVSDAFVAAAESSSLWNGWSGDDVASALHAISPDNVLQLQWDDLRPLTGAMMSIVDCKSRSTYRHSQGITLQALRLCDHFGIRGERRTQVEIAAHLHDVGKLRVPNTILDKPGRLDEEERRQIQLHAVFTREVLTHVPELAIVARWASQHHECLDGSGYPDGLRAADLDQEARLIAVADLYQALTEPRVYRTPSGHERAMEILRHNAREGRLDASVVRAADRVLEPVPDEVRDPSPRRT